MSDCHYMLKAIKQQPTRHEDYAVTMNLILERLNALENYAGAPRSSWYGVDPRTGTNYGPPEFSEWKHLRITYEGAPARRYIRERVDQLRAMIKAPVFPWRYTPSIEDMDQEPHRRCGVQAAQYLEMLQAIGREYGDGGSRKRFIVHTTHNDNGVITDEYSEPTSRAKAGFSSEYVVDGSESVSFRKDASYSWNACTIPHVYQDGTGDLTLRYLKGGSEPEQGKLSITIYESKYYDTISSSIDGDGYDWIEDECKDCVIVLSKDDGTTDDEIVPGSEEKTGLYCYSGYYDGSYNAACEGGNARYRADGGTTPSDTTHLAPISNNFNEEFGDSDWHEYPAEFITSEDGSVSPVIPTDLPVGTAETVDVFWKDVNSKLTYAISTYGSIASIEHVRSCHYRSPLGSCSAPHEGDVMGYGGSAYVNGTGMVMAKSRITSSYMKDYHSDHSGGWLLWTEPYIPSGYPESLKV